ncbi:acetyl-CoA carboxylase biotin carboxyl carrier protein [Caballeronia ptereochthonis]|uniref:Biotin carboxyl carrier protein of acetyl-CoA carboxylase n=1 Tax=Caballeronia ptereochthonis TaxID=1777144 RepID=A0A158DAB1_9BURK|nr:biotin/lipoyl-containing protein [Caballeronia ptereochthonis]SAK91614.1 Biotin carboxyl carrier protein of acetyl-CoA carboxylase [Caballeronia ptereochthonis]
MTRENELDIGELRQIAGWLEAAGVGFIEIARGRSVARLTLDHPTAREPAAKVETASLERPAPMQVKACHAGRFLRTHPGRATALVEAGASVRAGDIVAILQVAELCLPVVTPADGVLGEWLVDEGTVVGFGAALASLAERST